MAVTSRLIVTSMSARELNLISVDTVALTRPLPTTVNVTLDINYSKMAKPVRISTSVQRHRGFAVSSVRTPQEGKFSLISSSRSLFMK